MPARTGKVALSRERVLGAAVALADADGVGGVTMRRLADALDCEAMSLYHYVDDKKALLAGLAEVVVGEVVAETLGTPPTGPDDWRAVVRARCLGARRVMLRHPWAPALLATQSRVPPNVFAVFEALVGTMVEGGCDYELAHRAIHSLGSLVLGFTQELFEPSPGEEGTSAAEMEAMAAAMPHLTRLAATAVHEVRDSLSLCDTQSEFEFTLDLVLDGLEARRIAGGAGQAP